MAQTTTKRTKAAAARPSAVGPESTTGDLKRAVGMSVDLSEGVLKSVEASQLAAIKAVRKFVDTVDEVLPAPRERPSRRESVIDAALEMADRLVTTQYDFLRSVVRSAGPLADQAGHHQEVDTRCQVRLPQLRVRGVVCPSRAVRCPPMGRPTTRRQAQRHWMR
jgi:hypothetical protein